MTDALKRTFAFDFDGVLSEYHGFAGVEHTGAPIREVVEAIRTLKSLGHHVIVYSTRDSQLIRDYCNTHDIPIDYINENPLMPHTKGPKPIAFAYVDDRAVCFQKQSADELVRQLLTFKPYWKE